MGASLNRGIFCNRGCSQYEKLRVRLLTNNRWVLKCELCDAISLGAIERRVGYAS